MPEFDEFIFEAIEECRELLDSSEALLRQPGPGSAREIFRRVHTLKSNTALIPGSKTLSLLAQTVETLMATVEGDAVPPALADDLDEAFRVMSQILDALKSGGLARELDASAYRCVAALRVKSAR